MNRVETRSHHTPTLIPIEGCPCEMTPYYQTSKTPEGERRKLVYHYTTMRLVHLSEDGKRIKNELSLRKVHGDLANNALALHQSGSSNILLSKVSFDCLIKTTSGKIIRDYITFNLKIRGTNTKADSVLSYDMIEKAYGSKENLYKVLEHLYKLGRSKADPDEYGHGNRPKYDRSPEQDQFIRHTEQLLAAYLMLPEAAQMLSEQLRGAIRAKYPDATSVRMYNMGLHMHSTKTCCAPCEYTLLGLMNQRKLLKQDGKKLGFLYNFARASDLENDALRMSRSKKSRFRLLVTVTATERFNDHRKKLEYTKVTLKDKSVPFYDISVKSKKASRTIFTTMVNPKYDIRRIPDIPNLSDITVGISGSKQTKGSPGTMSKVKEVREKEIEESEHIATILRSTKSRKK